MQWTFRYLLALLFCALPGSAQVSAVLSGTVTDQSGGTVSGATVTAKSVDTGATRSTVTDAAGRYQVFSLPVGQYEVRAKKAGFTEEVRTGVQLVVGQDATVDLVLRVGESSQQVTVNGDAPPVSVTTTDISGLVGEQQVKDLPLNGRSYDELLTLNPGVVNFTWEKTGGIGVSNSTVGNNFAVSGNRPQQNLFLLNGVEFTGAAENNMQPGGTSQQLLGVDAVREFNLLRDSYGAEYGKRPGAQVLIVTQSGTNQLHGSLYEFLRNNALDARNYFDPGFGSRLSAQPVWRLAGRTDPEGQDLRVRQLSRNSASTCTRPAWTWFPTRTRATGTLPCKLVSPAPSPCPASGLAFVGVSPLINAVARAEPRRSGLRRNLGSVQQSSADHSRRLRNGAAGSHFFREGYAERGLHHRRQRRLHAHQHQRVQHGRRRACASRWRACEETHVFSPTVLNTARVGFSRAGYFFTGEPTPGTPAASLPGFLAGRPDRRGGGGRQRGVESDRPSEPGRKQQRKQSGCGAKSVHV